MLLLHLNLLDLLLINRSLKYCYTIIYFKFRNLDPKESACHWTLDIWSLHTAASKCPMSSDRHHFVYLIIVLTSPIINKEPQNNSTSSSLILDMPRLTAALISFAAIAFLPCFSIISFNS